MQELIIRILKPKKPHFDMWGIGCVEIFSKGHQAKCALSAVISKMRGVPDAPTYRSMRITSYRAACNIGPTNLNYGLPSYDS